MIRVTLFPFNPDWTDSVREKVKHKTVVSPMRSGNEQRTALRTKPRRELSFTVFTEDEAQSQLLQSILVDSQASPVGVPWWQDLQQFEGSLAAGATAISVDTTTTMFGVASMLMLWTSPTNYEVQTIQSVGAGVVTISPLSKAWGRCSIVPVFSGRFPVDLDIPAITSTIARVPVTFEVDA